MEFGKGSREIRWLAIVLVVMPGGSGSRIGWEPLLFATHHPPTLASPTSPPPPLLLLLNAIVRLFFAFPPGLSVFLFPWWGPMAVHDQHHPSPHHHHHLIPDPPSPPSSRASSRTRLWILPLLVFMGSMVVVSGRAGGGSLFNHRLPFSLSRPTTTAATYASTTTTTTSSRPTPKEWLGKVEARWHECLSGSPTAIQNNSSSPFHQLRMRFAPQVTTTATTTTTIKAIPTSTTSRLPTLAQKRRRRKRKQPFVRSQGGLALCVGGRSINIHLPSLHRQQNLTFAGHMIAGAIARSCAQTAMHPANVMKTIIQTEGKVASRHLRWSILTRGAGAQFVLSIPHGAMAFALVEGVKKGLVQSLPNLKFSGPVFDFVSSAISTFLCSAISTPQMVITDRIMAGYYPNLVSGVTTLIRKDGLKGLYAGWFAALCQKIPSYGLTWVFFQQLKIAREKFLGDHEATNTENIAMGSMAAALTVTILIPLDTIKTRIVTQAAGPGGRVPYKGVADCFVRIMREEGLKTFYKPLLPRLVSVVPMIGIQFGVYEGLKRAIRSLPERDVGGVVGGRDPSAERDELSIEENLFDEVESA